MTPQSPILIRARVDTTDDAFVLYLNESMNEQMREMHFCDLWIREFGSLTNPSTKTVVIVEER